MEYSYNFIYNRCDGIETDDTRLALDVVAYLEEKIRGWGQVGYFADRDATPGRSIFDELFKIVRTTDKTLIVITPEFRKNCWAKYSKQAAFKYLLDCQHAHKLIPIAINIPNNASLEELNVNEPLHIRGSTAREWENEISNKRSLNRLKMLFDPVSTPLVDIEGFQERGDNRLRTDRQHLVARPASAEALLTSRSSSLTSLTSRSALDEACSTNAPELSEPTQYISSGISSLSGDNQSLPDPRLSSVEPTYTLLYSRAALSTVSVDAISVSPVNNTCVQNVSEQLPIAEDLRMMVCSDEPEVRAAVQQSLSVVSLLQNKQSDERYRPVRNYANGQLSTNSLTEDTDLSMDDDIRSASLADNIAEGRILYEPRPESLAGANVTPEDRPEVQQLSHGSFDNSGHDSADSSDKDLTTLKRPLMSESGYTPSSPKLSLNQTDDAKTSTLDLGVEPVNTSGSVDPVDTSGAVDPVNTNCATVGSQCSEIITDNNALATAVTSDSPVTAPNGPSIASEAVHINGDADTYSADEIFHTRLGNMCYFLVKCFVNSDLAFM